MKKQGFYLNVLCSNELSKLPSRGSQESAGLDLYSIEELEIPSNSSKLISTGLMFEFPAGYVGIIKSRSGLSVKNKVETGAGVIDSDYRGEVKVHLHNFGDEPVLIKIHDRIAQIIFVPIWLGKPTQVKIMEVKTNRGNNGFGSTGK